MNKALVVGIDKYAQCPLFGCCNDANSIEELLAHNEDGSPNFYVKKRLNVCTKGELKALTWKDIYFDKRILSVNKQLTQLRRNMAKTKS